MTIDASVLLGFCKSFTTGLCQKADKRKFHEWTPYNVNKYTHAFVRREGMHFVFVSELLLIYYFCTFSLRMTAIVWILFIHFYGFRFFNDQDIGEPSPLPPHLSMGCGVKKVWSFYPLFLLLLSRAMQNPNMILRLLPCILPHRRISYRSNEAVRLERANRVQVSS